jgi:cation:H+ antiporter
MLPVNLALLGVGAYGLYVSTDWLVNWASSSSTKFIADNTGLLSGILMVLPNAVLAFYYAWRGNPEVVYTSQIGDGHISIPLCLGVYTLYHSAKIPPFFQTGVLLLVGAATLHFIFVAMLGRIPRIVGVLLTIASLVFLYNVVKK